MRKGGRRVGLSEEDVEREGGRERRCRHNQTQVEEALKQSDNFGKQFHRAIPSAVMPGKPVGRARAAASPFGSHREPRASTSG